VQGLKPYATGFGMTGEERSAERPPSAALVETHSGRAQDKAAALKGRGATFKPWEEKQMSRRAASATKAAPVGPGRLRGQPNLAWRGGWEEDDLK